MKNQLKIILVNLFVVFTLQAMDTDTDVDTDLKDKSGQPSVVFKASSLAKHKSVIEIDRKTEEQDGKEEDRLKTAEDELKREVVAQKPTGIPALPILSLGIEATLAEIIAARKDEKLLLKPLDEDQQAAGVIGSKCYASSLKSLEGRITFKTLHDEGNALMTVKELQEVFFKSMFQYYTNEFLSYDMSAYYMPYMPSPEDYSRFINLVSMFGLDLNDFVPRDKPTAKPWFRHNRQLYSALLETVQKAIASFKKNESFAKLAGAYQRWKIIAEKVESTEQNSTEKFGDFVYTVDRIPTDLQAMIYYWMQEGYELFLKKFKDALPSERNTSGDFLATFVPSFITRPYYAKIMAMLDELSKPVEKLKGISL